MKATFTQRLFARISAMDAHHRLFISMIVAAIFLLSPTGHGHGKMGLRVIATWDIFALCLLALAWTRISTAQPLMVIRSATLQHTPRKILFVFVLAAACASMAAVFALLSTAKKFTSYVFAGHIALALATVVLSWVLIHTIFALQYAYLYYRPHRDHNGTVHEHSGGLVFPEGKMDPDYYDFAYFSFVVGMTSQVSDVQISSRIIRRWALFHGVISFAFNTTVLALGVNIASSLL